MAGAGYKLFNTGDVLTAAQVNTYLQEQAVMRFANATARTTALSGVLAEGMMSYLDDTNSVEVYNGSAWVAVGNTGDITEVTTAANSGLTGGATSGAVALRVNTTAKGSIIAGTGATTLGELTVGANNTVLTADSSTATGLKWATPSAGALTLIKAVSYSGAANTGTDFHSQLTSTYEFYLVLVRFSHSVGAVSLDMQMSYGSTNQTSGYYGTYSQLTNATTWGNGQANSNSSNFRINYPGSVLLSNTQIWLEASAAWGTSCKVAINGTGYGSQNNQPLIFGNQADTSQSYDGFVITPASGTITGTVVLYGVQKS